LIRDPQGDGINEVIINKNHAPSRLLDRIRSFDKGEVYSLVWDEGSLLTSWKTREVNGYISDFQVKDADNDGNVELVVATVDFGDIFDKKIKSNILFFELF
jgi:hypothetical protein